MHSGSRKSDSDVKDDAGLSRAATGEQLKCERLSQVLENGYLVCDGMDINSTCWTRCIEGYEKENPLTGSYICLENGEWEGEGATCVRKDCGSLDQVIVSLSNVNTYVLDIMNSNRKFDISLAGTLSSPTTNLNCLCFNSSFTNLSSQSTEREKISTSVAIFDVRDVNTLAA